MTEQTNKGEANRDRQLPNSKRVYVPGKIHPDVRVPLREISLAPTKSMSGEIEVNEPVRVYDTSGPWGDDHSPNVNDGLPQLRSSWIRNRGHTQEIEGRKVLLMDDGWLSDAHRAASANGSSKSQAPNSGETPKFN